MISPALMKRLAVITLVCFAWMTFGVQFAIAASDQDNLQKAQELYRKGDYDGAIRMATTFIDQIRTIVAQKKSVAEAYYLLAKIYYEVNDDTKVADNLRKCFEAFPSYYKDETNPDFKKRVEKARAAMTNQPSPAGAQEKEGPKSEKKSSLLMPILIGVGVAAVAALLIFVVFKTSYDITGSWTFNFLSTEHSTTGTGIYTFTGTKESGTTTSSNYPLATATYTVASKAVSITMTLNTVKVVITGNFTDKKTMSGTYVTTINNIKTDSGTWTATKNAAS
jgi:hypothetical protein